jgi:hypothetical protein
MKNSRTLALALGLAFSTGSVMASGCNASFTTQAYQSCYSYASGQSDYIVFTPSKADVVGQVPVNRNYASEVSSEDDSQAYQEKAVVSGAVPGVIDSRKAYRQYQAESFVEEALLPQDRRVNTDILDSSFQYFNGLLRSRSLTSMGQQSQLFSMSNVVPMSGEVESLWKEIDKKIALDVVRLESKGSVLVVYSGVTHYRTKSGFSGRNTFGIKVSFLEPNTYFKFWYEKAKNGSHPSVIKGYYFPNKKDLKDINYYSARISHIEKHTGLKFILKGFENTSIESKIKNQRPESRDSKGPLKYSTGNLFKF